MKVQRIWALVLACLLALGACKDKAQTIVTGTAAYRERIALPGNAVLEARLVELKPGGDAGTVLAMIRVEPVQGIPVAFTLSVLKSAIKANRSYGVVADISVESRVWFESPAPVAVLTGGAGAHVDLILKRMPRPKSYDAYEEEAQAIDKRAETLKRVEGTFNTAGAPASFVAYVEKNGAPLLIKEGRELGPKSSAAFGYHFQGATLIRYTEDMIRRNPVTDKQEIIALKLYFDAGHYVGGTKTINGEPHDPLATEIPEALVNAEVAKSRVAAALAAQVPKSGAAKPTPDAKPKPGAKPDIAPKKDL